MKFSAAALAGALATLANAKAVITNTAFSVQAGSPFTLTWTNATGAVTVQLVTGDPNNLKPVGSPLTTGATGGSASVIVPATIPTGEYAFEVIDETEVPNYSIMFEFEGSASAVSSTTTAASTTSSAAHSSTTSSSASSTTEASSTMTTMASSSASSNGTTSTTHSRTSTTSARASSTTAPTNTNDGQRFASPLALVLVTVATLVCFN